MNNNRDSVQCRSRWKRILLSKIVKLPKIDFWFPEDVYLSLYLSLLLFLLFLLLINYLG